MLQNNGIMRGNVVNINRKVMTNFFLLLTLHYEDVADTELVKQQKKRAFDICFDPGSEKRSELDDRSRQIGTLYMPKIDSDVIIVQLRGGM